ncbi:hypothetical protein [Blastococcus colisei]|uniref:hypothetical protein n=1 Tax=Blastococcus colisei TaxID=1564162 RepID=UPI00114EEB5F|nr:hypothetical protein [Blastococcus colisei]
MTDGFGVRWTVRARQLRGTGTPPPRPGPEEESLRRRLTAALSRLPAPAVAGGTGDWRLPADTADVEMQATFAEFRDTPMRQGTAPWAVGHAVRLVGEAIAHLRTPRSETWEVELVARGRIRRWARWQITGADAAAQALATVAAGVGAGRVPEPWAATLVDVVDQRPPYRPQPVA